MMSQIKMLKYRETNWLSERGFSTHSYQLTFSEAKCQCTVEEQKKRVERLSLVKIFDEKETEHFLDICAEFQQDNRHFYYHRKRRFHTTLLGFPVVRQVYYETIKEKINEHFEKSPVREMCVKFDLVRLGTKYANHNNLSPVPGISNGTIIAIGDFNTNERFITFGNNLCSYLLEDKNLRTVLGKEFRRRFPTVWCTMGHYTKDLNVTQNLETLFRKHENLDSRFFNFPCYEVQLGCSQYKDLRDWRPIRKFVI
jgi:hypothetical protein